MISATRCSCYMQYLGCTSKHSNTQKDSVAQAVGQTCHYIGIPTYLLSVFKLGHAFALFSQLSQLVQLSQLPCISACISDPPARPSFALQTAHKDNQTNILTTVASLSLNRSSCRLPLRIKYCFCTSFTFIFIQKYCGR